MILLVSGSRDYPDKEQAMMRLRDWVTSSELVMHGDCPSSPDMWADDVAKEFGVPVKACPADWSKGYCAGPIRNEQMVLECTMALIFWDGKSRGASNVIELCKLYHKEHLVVMPQKDCGISFCNNCHSMTHTLNNAVCGKCKEIKSEV